MKDENFIDYKVMGYLKRAAAKALKTRAGSKRFERSLDECDELMQKRGLGRLHFDEDEEDDYDRPLRRRKAKKPTATKKALLESIEDAYERAAAKYDRSKPSRLEKKLSYCADKLSLSHAEKELLTYAVLAEELDLDFLLEEDGFSKQLSYILELKPAELSKALYQKSTLMYTGLLESEPSRRRRGRGKSTDISADSLFQSAIMDTHIKAENIFRDFFLQSRKKGIGLSYFKHMKEDIELLKELISNALKNRSKGVNILLYGSPGCGKSEFTRSLLAAMKLNGVYIESESSEKRGRMDRDGGRLSGYNVCRKVNMGMDDTVFVFDEADEELNTIKYSIFGKSEVDKSDIIEALESNELPCIWITNSIRGMHDAVKRRFSTSIMFDSIPRDTLARLLKNTAKKHKLPQSLFDDNMLSYLMKYELSVGHLSLAAQRVKEMMDESGMTEEKLRGRFEKIIASMASLVKSEDVKPLSRNSEIMDYFRLELLNIDKKASDIVKSVKLAETIGKRTTSLPLNNVNLLFHGAPGVGKSEFAKYLAKESGKQAHVVRASDMLDKYIGETEKNIRKVFEECEKSRKVLVIDEADSFFAKRGNAVRSWEVNQVNEILNSMESFKGVLICTTNFIDNFDTASLRRFGLKVKFDFLSTTQKAVAAELTFGDILSSAEMEELKQRAASIPLLAPGDFKSVLNRAVFMDNANAETIAAELEKEASYKEGAKTNRVGFK